MSIENLITLLSADFDVHYGDAPDGTVCPYLVIKNVTHPNFAADNKTFSKTTSLELRLVESEVHDWQLIKQLEDLLDSAELTYSSSDISEESEHVCETIYTLRLLGGNTNG